MKKRDPLTPNTSFRAGPKSAPKSAAAVLDSTFKHLHLKNKVEEYAAFPHWPEVVGAEVSQVAIPEKIISGKILVVRVLDAAWAQELTLQKAQILEKVNSFGAGALIEDLRFVTGNPQAFKKAVPSIN